MKKYIELILLILIVIILINGCTQSSLTGHTIKKLEDNNEKGTLKIEAEPVYAKIAVDGKFLATGILDKRLLEGEYKIEISAFDYTTKNYMAVIQPDKLTYIHSNLEKIEKTKEDQKEKEERLKEERNSEECNPAKCDKRDIEECHGTTKWIYDYYCYSDSLCTYDLDFEYNSIDCGYTKSKEVLTCSSGWKCKDPSYKGYQHLDCSWSSMNYCEHGCNSGICNSPLCSESYLSEKRCLENWVEQKYLYEDCDTNWVKIEYCEYGCQNGICTQTQVCIPNEKRCFENNLQQCSFDGLNWQIIQSCEYRCENNQCIIEPTNQIIVSRVIDGDTVELNSGDKVRLIGINAPEEGQYFYSEAKNKLKELVEGKIITLEKDISDKDMYGRLLRYIYVNDLFVNLEIVRLGYAEAYEYLPDTEHSILLKESEKEAKENERGIWEKSEYISCFILSDFHYNAAGNDNYNLNDEYVIFENECSYPIEMTDWTIKDETASHIYTIPQFTFKASSTFTLYTGTGSNTGSKLYWGMISGNYASIWNNNGDTLFLRDKNGKLVLSYSY